MNASRTKLIVALVAILTLSITAVAVAQTGTIQIVEVPGSDSGVTGSATVVPEGEDATLITVRLEGNVDPELNYPGHLHEGTYDQETGQFDFDPQPSYDLNSAVGGVSETRLEVPFEELVTTDYLVAMHLPDGFPGPGAGTDVDGDPYGRAVAAGPIETITEMPNTGGPPFPSVIVTIVAGVALVFVGVFLTSRWRTN